MRKLKQKLNLIILLSCLFSFSISIGAVGSNDFTHSELTNIALSENVVNVEYTQLNHLLFKGQEMMKWESPKNVNTRNSLVYVSLERRGYLKNKVDNGIWLWFIKRQNNSSKSGLTFFMDDSDSIYGVENTFTGVGVKVNELSLISILNNGSKNTTPIEKGDFNENYRSMQQKFKYFNCEISDDKILNLRITFLNGYIYLEHFRGSIATPTHFELCFLGEFNFDKDTEEVSFLITGGLGEETASFTIDNISMAEIKSINSEEEQESHLAFLDSSEKSRNSEKNE